MTNQTEPSRTHQSIGQLARSVGVGIDAIRFYERIGLLPAAKRSAAGYRLYNGEDRQRLAFIRRAQDLGFSLEEIASLLKLSRPGGDVAAARALAAEKLEVVNGRIEELLRLRVALESLVAACPGHGDPSHCPILAALLAGEGEVPRPERSASKLTSPRKRTRSSRG